mmetsp:Transcript_5164/g.15332  ORF Transcript_5164/g.15332 Transcript_5164/m.15332 type:complete len:135 (-) Transcript_5164:17-421(-)
MEARGSPLAAGTPPILTRAFHLPCDRVLHVTGPTLAGRGGGPTPTDEAQLAAAYSNCLEAAKNAGIRSVAFPCISTGLFAYPQRAAATLALQTTGAWLASNDGALDAVIFDVFTDEDETIYRELARGLPRVSAT